MKKGIKIISCLVISSMMLMGCGQKEYYQAVNNQNQAITEMNIKAQEDERRNDQIHEQNMLKMMSQSMESASRSPEITDDILVPILFMNMENQRTMAKVLMNKNGNVMALQPIKAPDSFGDNVRKSAGLILGIGGIALGISQSHALKDVAVAGIGAAGTKITASGDGNTITSDSYKNGTDNVINGNENSISAKSCPDCDKDEESFSDGRPANWQDVCTSDFLASIPGNCSSCDSYYGGRCSVTP